MKAVRGILAGPALLALTIGLWGCELPQPFAHDEDSPPPLAAAQGRVLCIASVPGFPAGLGTAFRLALADELVKREVLATAAEPCLPGSPRLGATAVAGDAGGASLIWMRAPAAGFLPRTVIYAFPADEPLDWTATVQGWAAMTAERLGYAIPVHRSARSPLADILDPGTAEPAPAVRQAAVPPRAPAPPEVIPPARRIWVEGVEGAPGNGNVSLRFAMMGHLRRLGLTPEIKAEPLPGQGKAATRVKGVVKVDPPRDMAGRSMQKVLIVWTVGDTQGKNLGTLEQEADLPAGSLDRAWGMTADAAAGAAAKGVAEIVAKFTAQPAKP